MATRYVPLVDAAVVVKLETTTAHLWFEELISGDKSINIEDVWRRLDQAEWYANAMLKGGENQKGKLVPLDDPALRHDIEQTLVGINTFRAIAHERWNAQLLSGIGSDNALRFDEAFNDLFKIVDAVEIDLKLVMKNQLQRFRNTQLLISLIAVILFVLIVFLFRSYEKKLVEDLHELKEGKDQLNNVIDGASLGYWDWHYITDEHYVNNRWLDILGLERSDIVNNVSDWEDRIHPDDMGKVISIIEEALKSRSTYVAEFRMKHKEGHWVWIQGSGKVITWNPTTDEPQRICGTHIDITERKQAVELVHESEVRFKDIAESMSDWIWEVDADYVYTYCSARVETVLGYRPDELIGKTAFDLMPADEVDQVKTLAIEIASDKRSFHNIENWCLTKDGRRLCFLTSGTAVLDDEGKLLGYRGVDTDITDRKQAEKELKQSETKFRNLVQCSLQGIFVHKDFKPLFANQKCADIFGYNDPEEILKLDSILESFISPEEHERLLDYKTRRLNGEPDIPVVYECLGIRKGRNPFWFQNHVSMIDWHGEKAILATVMDITERKEKEQELFKSHTLFNQAEHLGKLGYWEWDIEQDGIINCSEEYANIFDMTVEEVINLYPNASSSSIFGRYIHEDDLERYTQITELAYERKESWDIEFRVLNEKSEIYVHEIGEPIIDESGAVIRTFGTLQDITVRKQTEEQLSYQASHDALTGLINRHEFERRAERLLSTTRRDEDKHALCYLDLDQFKVVNDTCGHAAGDEMLRQLSTVLQNTVRHRDTLARLGGDEFGVLMEHCPLDNAHRVANSLLNAIQDYQFSWEEYSFKVGVSIGLVPITTSITNLTELLRDADAACYMAKDNGRNRIHVYHTEDSEIAKRHGEMQWVTRIQHALDEDQFCLYAQSIVPLDNSSDKHYELLVRMIDDKRETIPPGAFLAAAERYNLMTQIDYWVIEKTFSLLAEHKAFQSQIKFVSINLSGQSLIEQDLLDFIITQLDETGVDAGKICFEITETAAISNLGVAMKSISTLKELGCRFALDDFGSGLSSFAYLKNLPVDYLKIDGMFVRDIVEDPIDHAMVKSINEIGHVMGMQTIAEFVENDVIKGMLKEIGVNYAQGYGIDKPMCFEELLSQSNNETGS